MNIGCYYIGFISTYACCLCGCTTTSQFSSAAQQYGIRSNDVDDRVTCTLLGKAGKRTVIFDQHFGERAMNVEFSSQMAYGKNIITCKVANAGGPSTFDFTIWTKRAPSPADPWPQERELYRFHGYCDNRARIPECDTSPVARVTVNINNIDPAIPKAPVRAKNPAQGGALVF